MRRRAAPGKPSAFLSPCRGASRRLLGKKCILEKGLRAPRLQALAAKQAELRKQLVAAAQRQEQLQTQQEKHVRFEELQEKLCLCTKDLRASELREEQLTQELLHWKKLAACRCHSSLCLLLLTKR